MPRFFDHQPLPPMSFVCLDHEHGGAMACLRQDLRAVTRHCPELRLIVLSATCGSRHVGAVEVTWLMEGSRDIHLVPKRMAAWAAALIVERQAVDVLDDVLNAAFKQNLDTPTDALDLHVVLTADAAVLAGPHGDVLCLAAATRDLFYQGGVHAFPLLFEVPGYVRFLEHLDRSMDRTLLILKQLAARYLSALPGEDKQERSIRDTDPDEVDVMLDCWTQFLDLRVLGLDQFIHSCRAKPLPFPLRALPRSSSLGHVFPAGHDNESALERDDDGDSDASDGLAGVS